MFYFSLVLNVTTEVKLSSEKYKLSINRGNSERDLLQQLIAGDEGGFVGLYEIYNRSIYSFVLKYVSSAPLAEDLTQEVFIKIWESRSNLTEVKSFKAYLFITARNHTLNSLKVVFRSEAAISELIAGFVSLRNETEDEILDKDYILFLKNTLNSLPPRTREIFKLCREEQKTYEEVAKSLNISRNAVKNHMVQSMKVLGSSIKKEFGISLSLIIAILSTFR